MIQTYIFRARRTSDNVVVTGKLQANSLEVAKKVLKQNGLLPIAVNTPKDIWDIFPFLGKTSLKDRTMFARQLSTMIKAGLTLTQAMRLLVAQTKKGKFRQVEEAILSDVQDGFSFSNALAKFPDVFDAIFINVVRSGEATGKLDEVLDQISTHMEGDVKLSSKIKGAMIYPAFIIVAMLGVAVVMLWKVIPQLSEMFTSSNMKLPASTTFLLWLSKVLTTQWWLIIIIAVALVVAVKWFISTPQGDTYWSKMALKIPVLGGIIEQTTMARFGRFISLLLGSGVPLLESLKLLNDSISNKVYRRAINNVSLQVERGVPMSKPISEDPVFPLMVGQMVSVGEQTGKMDEVMTRLADYYETEVDSKVSGLSSLLEPMIIILLGIGVAFLVVSILLPIYQISTSV